MGEHQVAHLVIALPQTLLRAGVLDLARAVVVALVEESLVFLHDLIVDRIHNELEVGLSHAVQQAGPSFRARVIWRIPF